MSLHLLLSEPKSNESVSFGKIEPETVMLVLTVSPWLGEIDALTLPETILLRFNPVTPLAGILYKPDPSPIKEPVNAPVV